MTRNNYNTTVAENRHVWSIGAGTQDNILFHYLFIRLHNQMKSEHVDIEYMTHRRMKLGTCSPNYGSA